MKTLPATERRLPGRRDASYARNGCSSSCTLILHPRNPDLTVYGSASDHCFMEEKASVSTVVADFRDISVACVGIPEDGNALGLLLNLANVSWVSN
ncbi:hypothetical protein B9479_003842 [Cryptococcus floricola]|uniref:Uncharacterized protein n=1 Tax=Cryptococcus floricola TaxID=2591691 RepID=A0A5D3AX80_9TREE|nr:hypothetical protein B9479_003842 [Cryptococcus floricola]